MEYEINDRVKIWVDNDDSGMAVDKFGVEPQNDFFAVEYYPEQIEAIIISNNEKLLAQQVFLAKNGKEVRGKTFDISYEGINNRIKIIKDKIKEYNLTIEIFLEDIDNEKDLNFFHNII